MQKKNMIKAIFLIIGIIGFIWFFISVPGAINIGNITGMIVCSLIILYSIRMPYINNWIFKLWEKSIGKIFLIFIGTIAAAIIGLVLFITGCMITAANKQVSENATVVVLGCKVNGERASLMLTERLEAAYSYLNENEEVKCILSGGQGADENISEAECMYRYLVDKGIDEERLYKEENSTSTRENIVFSKEIIEQYGLSSKLAIVTNEFHEYRAGKVAASVGLEAGAVSAKTAWWLLPTYYVRELFGIVYEWIF